MRKASPYSPDLAPSVFYPFDHIKEQLKGTDFDNIDDLCSAILSIFGIIQPETLQEVFREWEELVEHEGVYVM